MSFSASQDVSIVIYRNGKRLSISQLEKDYIEWVRQMHEWYDQEINCGDDEPTVILSPPGKRKLGITQDGHFLLNLSYFFFHIFMMHFISSLLNIYNFEKKLVNCS